MRELLAPVPLSPEHDIERFACGVDSLDDWLRRRARPNQASGTSRTYVVAAEQGIVVAYYCLASGGLARADAPSSLRRNSPDPLPVVVLGRLAVDARWQGRGVGAGLLQDAVLRSMRAAAIIGIRGILVHALSDEAARFYEHYGFVSTLAEPRKLVLSLELTGRAGS